MLLEFISKENAIMTRILQEVSQFVILSPASLMLHSLTSRLHENNSLQLWKFKDLKVILNNFPVWDHIMSHITRQELPLVAADGGLRAERAVARHAGPQVVLTHDPQRPALEGPQEQDLLPLLQHGGSAQPGGALGRGRPPRAAGKRRRRGRGLGPALRSPARPGPAHPAGA